MLPAAARPLWGPCLGLRGTALRFARQQVPRVSAVRLMRCSSHRRGEALAGAPLDNAPKEYPPKIQQLVQDIASLTLLEISDLNELLKKTLKIQEVGLMPMGGAMPAAAPAAAAPEVSQALASAETRFSGARSQLPSRPEFSLCPSSLSRASQHSPHICVLPAEALVSLPGAEDGQGPAHWGPVSSGDCVSRGGKQ
ncbi:39S ribosomal protein L12, mitochondrial [Myotis lucifugus]|nr:39S ribosomal protein L12, mitochondrial [Myotis lucifugus]